MTGWAWVNGEVTPMAEARVSIWDRGFLYGDGVFETLRVYGGKPFKPGAHLRRLEQGLIRLGIEYQHPVGQAMSGVQDLLEQELGDELMLRITVTRGESPGGWRGNPMGPPTVVVVLWESPLPEDAWYQHGVKAVWCDVPMMSAPWWPAEVKHCNWLPRILARPVVDAAGAAEGFLRTMDGDLAEGLTSNAFVVQDGLLRTPTLDTGALPGITREVVLRLARERELAVSEETVPAAAVEQADEVFYTNAGLGLVPVVEFAGRAIGDGTPGPVWRALHDAYRRETRA